MWKNHLCWNAQSQVRACHVTSWILTSALFFSTGTMTFPTIAFWGLNIMLMMVDSTGKPSFITRYRIQMDKNNPVCPALNLSQYLLQFHFMRILSLSHFFLTPELVCANDSPLPRLLLLLLGILMTLRYRHLLLLPSTCVRLCTDCVKDTKASVYVVTKWTASTIDTL